MDTVSVRQPWAYLLVRGLDHVMTRHQPLWRLFPHVLAIHASRTYRAKQKEMTVREPYRTLFARLGFPPWKGLGLPRQCVVGVVRVAGCYRSHVWGEYLLKSGLATGREVIVPGHFAWVCDRAYLLPEPVPEKAPATGQLRPFDWSPPPGLSLPEWASPPAPPS